jgi:hypothetical protein
MRIIKPDISEQQSANVSRTEKAKDKEEKGGASWRRTDCNGNAFTRGNGGDGVCKVQRSSAKCVPRLREIVNTV